MEALWGMAYLSGLYPLYRAWRACRGLTVRHALVWAGAAWLTWTAAAAGAGDVVRYLALCLTGCAGVAVLGARRPGAGAWHLVVAFLLLVLLRPLLEGLGALRLSGPHLAFLGAALAVALGNYLPTRLVPAALALAAGCALELADLAGSPIAEAAQAGPLLIALAPWLGLGVGWQASPTETEFDRTWRRFRNAYGLVWAQRLRDQFNRAAANAGWPVTLGWSGLRGEEPAQALPALHALLKRFRTGEEDRAP
jgi:hypothetical protein